MAHARVMAAREKESGTPGEAQSYDHIEQRAQELRLRRRAPRDRGLHQPAAGRAGRASDGSVIEGLTHAFSPSTDGLEAEVVDVGDGNPGDLGAPAVGKIALFDSLATPGKAWAAQEAGTVGRH